MLDIIYQDDTLVAINKPAGLLVHRSPIDRHETRFALQLLRDQLGQYVYPVHRLDKPTSGVLLFGLSPDAARALSDQFAAHSIQKHYLAVVRGYAPLEGEIDHPLTDKADAIADRDTSQPRPAREAHTSYMRLATVEIPEQVDRYPQARYSLVGLRPHTGRKHQLRRHMKHIGHPIIGDAKYGKGVHNRFFARRFGVQRLLLTCTGLDVKHPVSDESLHLVATPEQSLQDLLDALGWLSVAQPTWAFP